MRPSRIPLSRRLARQDAIDWRWDDETGFGYIKFRCYHCQHEYWWKAKSYVGRRAVPMSKFIVKKFAESYWTEKNSGVSGECPKCKKTGRYKGQRGEDHGREKRSSKSE